RPAHVGLVRVITRTAAREIVHRRGGHRGRVASRMQVCAYDARQTAARVDSGWRIPIHPAAPHATTIRAIESVSEAQSIARNGSPLASDCSEEEREHVDWHSVLMARSFRRLVL